MRLRDDKVVAPVEQVHDRERAGAPATERPVAERPDAPPSTTPSDSGIGRQQAARVGRARRRCVEVKLSQACEIVPVEPARGQRHRDHRARRAPPPRARPAAARDPPGALGPDPNPASTLEQPRPAITSDDQRHSSTAPSSAPVSRALRQSDRRGGERVASRARARAAGHRADRAEGEPQQRRNARRSSAIATTSPSASASSPPREYVERERDQQQQHSRRPAASCAGPPAIDAHRERDRHGHRDEQRRARSSSRTAPGDAATDRSG